LIEVDIVNQNEESAVITLGHEMLLHLKEYIDNPKGKKTTAHQDHKGWAENNTENSKIFNQYIQYLRGWYDNLKQFNDAENEKRKSNNENVISGN
jgi:hypothetical protein